MKQAIIAVTILAASAAAQADGCSTLSKMARAVMEARQNGAQMGDMMRVSAEIESPVLRKLAKAMVRDAYDIPRFSSDGYQQQSVSEFGNQIYRECDRNFNQ